MYKIQCMECKRIGIEAHYIGESSRSGFQRAEEHQTGLRNMDKESPLVKHQLEFHPEVQNFEMTVIKEHRKALQRQVMEAIMIEKSKAEVLINNKSEWARSKISKLDIGNEREKREKQKERQAKEKIEKTYTKEKETQEALVKAIKRALKIEQSPEGSPTKRGTKRKEMMKTTKKEIESRIRIRKERKIEKDHKLNNPQKKINLDNNPEQQQQKQQQQQPQKRKCSQEQLQQQLDKQQELKWASTAGETKDAAMNGSKAEPVASPQKQNKPTTTKTNTTETMAVQANGSKEKKKCWLTIASENRNTPRNENKSKLEKANVTPRKKMPVKRRINNTPKGRPPPPPENKRSKTQTKIWQFAAIDIREKAKDKHDQKKDERIKTDRSSDTQRENTSKSEGNMLVRNRKGGKISNFYKEPDLKLGKGQPRK